jgi:hypothetical protein
LRVAKKTLLFLEAVVFASAAPALSPQKILNRNESNVPFDIMLTGYNITFAHKLRLMVFSFTRRSCPEPSSSHCEQYGNK